MVMVGTCPVEVERRLRAGELMCPCGGVQPRTPAEVLELAVALKREVPDRTAAQVAAILRAHAGWAPDERTLQRHFARLELTTRPNGQPPQAFGRFEADAPNERWTGDALHGPTVDGRKAILVRVHRRSFPAADRVPVGPPRGHRPARGRAAQRARRPRDPGARSMSTTGRRSSTSSCCGPARSLGIRLVHSRPGQPAGRGKIERFFRTVREQFLVEIGSGRELDDLVQLNTLFTAWVETVYHRRDPLRDRADAAGTGGRLGHRRRCRHRRSCGRRSCGRSGAPSPRPRPSALHGNTYEVDAALIGRKVELVFDPFDLTDHRGPLARPADGARGPAPDRPARPPQGPTRRADTPPPAPTGIDYLDLVEAQHTAGNSPTRLRYSQLARRARRAAAGASSPLPGISRPRPPTRPTTTISASDEVSA